MTHGKCTTCDVVFRWTGKPLLRQAVCPRDRTHGLLARTAARLVKHMPVVDEHPLTAAGGDGPQALKNLLSL